MCVCAGGNVDDSASRGVSSLNVILVVLPVCGFDDGYAHEAPHAILEDLMSRVKLT